MQRWDLYIIKCGDGSLYTGVAIDAKKRFEEHKSGGRLCAKYLRGRGPLKMVYKKSVKDKILAMQLEYRVKQLSRVEKLALIKGKKS